MRLVKLAVASLSPTVGAVRSNTAAMVTAARRMADDGVTLGAFPEQVVGGYPPEDLVQWRAFLDAQRRALESFARETADAGTVFVLGLAVRGAGAALQRRGGRAPRPPPRLRAQGEAADLQRVLRGAHVLARRARPGPRRRRRAARRLPLRLRLRHRRGRGLRRRLGARRPDAPPLPLGRRDRRQRLGVAVPPGHRRHPPRDAGDARRRQPDGAGLRQRRRRPGRPHLRRRRLRLPERPAGARGAALRRGPRRRRSSTSIAPGGCGWSTRPGGPTARRSSSANAPVPVIRSDAETADTLRAAPIRRRPAAASSCRRRRRRRSTRATRALDELFEALALGVASYYAQDRRLPLARRWRSPAGATRC